MPTVPFSIAARCPRTGQLGVAALTARPAVGKLVAHVQSGGGAVATQATPNPFWRTTACRCSSRAARRRTS
ncbi:DUF1028 domain-containing protein [Micromonospora profundi]|uniref:DUF1028 domain-containing protein n=1 Tax=Micromonospora profundi TaxID=1420889 RepID=UPI003519E82F